MNEKMNKKKTHNIFFVKYIFVQYHQYYVMVMDAGFHQTNFFVFLSRINNWQLIFFLSLLFRPPLQF